MQVGVVLPRLAQNRKNQKKTPKTCGFHAPEIPFAQNAQNKRRAYFLQMKI